MSATMMMAEQRTEAEPREIGLHGWGTIAWSAAGGIALGGLLVALMTLSGRLSGFGLFMTASGLFVVGAMIGMVHALVLGFFGRPAEMAARDAMRDLGRGAVYALIALPFAWIVTMWIALSMPAIYMGRLPAMVGVGIGWLAGTAVVAAAAVAGWRMLRNAYARWPERQIGTVLVGATFTSLLVLFLMDRPEIWGLQLRVTETGAVLMAAFATLWIGGPVITLALRLIQRLPGRHPVPAFAPSWRAAGDLALGALAGVALGLIALPFVIPAALPGGAGGMVVASLGQALVDEVLLRLFLVTGVAWLLLRWGRVNAGEAAVISIAAAALVQVLLYAPGVAGLGFTTPLAAVAFTAVTVLVPGLVFGFLYWTRGLGTAVMANATALAVLALLAL
ncbi:MAG TPA: hypothetical protein VK933_07280 [Longimicrobiales bacterium]|nr:hypothetical protein [Longimicrobiales bacterium]